jgi:hypothetical protein
MLTGARRVALPALAAVSAAALYDERARRVMHVVSCFGPMAASYGLLTYQIHDLPAEEQKARFLDFHTEWAEQPLAGVLSLRGYYVKIGQVVSNQPALLPKPYRKSLKILQEEVPPEPFERIRGIVEDELGKIEDTFAAFDEVPLGAASIGQVHEARLKEGGEEVVVKVQYVREDAPQIKATVVAEPLTPPQVPGGRAVLRAGLRGHEAGAVVREPGAARRREEAAGHLREGVRLQAGGRQPSPHGE